MQNLKNMKAENHESDSEMTCDPPTNQNSRVVCNREKILQVINLQTNTIAQSLQSLEDHVRSLFSTNDYIQCQAFMSASYVQFKLACAQRMQGKHGTVWEVNFGKGYLARLINDNIVLLFRQPHFDLPMQETMKKYADED